MVQDYHPQETSFSSFTAKNAVSRMKRVSAGVFKDLNCFSCRGEAQFAIALDADNRGPLVPLLSQRMKDPAQGNIPMSDPLVPDLPCTSIAEVDAGQNVMIAG
jgi:hypothetical protein